MRQLFQHIAVENDRILRFAQDDSVCLLPQNHAPLQDALCTQHPHQRTRMAINVFGIDM